MPDHLGKQEMEISIHAPRVGSDRSSRYQCLLPGAFQSTLPVWGATGLTPVLIYWVPISIHAPRVGSDRGHDLHKVRHRAFQSTLPVWGATLETGSSLVCDIFQSTLPVWGATYQQGIERFWSRFQSTLPVWGATRLVWEHWKQFMGISIHAPRVGSNVIEAG